jgi:hypothetical protein
MNPLADRRGKVADPGAPSRIETPMQVHPWTEEAPNAVRAEDTDARYTGELFLPGWLRIERQPTAEQGPGGG